jgi:hypothetical protein
MGSCLPDIFLSYNRDDQATARRFADGFEHGGFNVDMFSLKGNALCLEKLGRHEEACDAILRKVWLDPPLESSGT